jgi:serine/threonine-protein kinase
MKLIGSESLPMVILVPENPWTWMQQVYRLKPIVFWGISALIGFSASAGLYFLNRSRRKRRIQKLGGDPEQPCIGPFQPLKLLGEGGFGQVWLAIANRELYSRQPTRVAIKTLRREALEQQDPAFKKRFLREAQALERLEHPHIVKLVHYELSSEQPYIAMEFVEGQTFAELLRRNPRGLPTEKALHLIYPVLEALSFAHNQPQPILHRDIKPENLMLNRSGEVKVMDFGLALSDGQSRLTGGDFVGTIQYAPPEAIQSDPSPASDQYAAGLVLHELLTGKPANPHQDPMLALQTLFDGSLPKLSELRPDLGKLAEAVDRMRSERPEERFAKIAEALECLRSVSSGK